MLRKSSLPFKTYSELGGRVSRLQIPLKHSKSSSKSKAKARAGERARAKARAGERARATARAGERAEAAGEGARDAAEIGQQPAREQQPEQEQEHDPSKVAVEIKIPPDNTKHFPNFLLGRRFNIRGKGLLCVVRVSDKF